jgi:sialic acid synthase SpsE
MKIIAELGTAHMGSLEKARELIQAASNAGADIIKLQIVYADEILHPKAGRVPLPRGIQDLYEDFKKLEVPAGFFAECKAYTEKMGKEFLCSVFGEKSLEEYLKLNPQMIKIASPELNHIPLLKALAATRKTRPLTVILSTGVSTLSDIEEALDILGREDVVLLHCITSYPAPPEEYNLALIGSLSRIFGCEIGISDHSTDPFLVPVLSAEEGAGWLEKHFTLDNSAEGLDDSFALNPIAFKKMCTALNNRGKEPAKKILGSYSPSYIQQVIGSGEKKLAESEKTNYERTRRSIHCLSDLNSGDKLTLENMAVLRTEKELSVGMHPRYFHLALGKSVSRPMKSGEGIQLTDLMSS